MSDNQPAQSFRSGRIRATIWVNTNTETGNQSYSVTALRTYKDGNSYKDTSSLSPADAVVAARLLEKAHDWTLDNPLNHSAEDQEAA